MDDKELIIKIASLKEIKPNQEWVTFARCRVFMAEAVEAKKPMGVFLSNFVFRYRAAFASLVLVGMLGGTLIFAQGALPGEALYPVKKITEKGLAILTNKDRMPAANLQLAEKRLKELSVISQRNMVQNLPTALKEYKDAKATAKKEVAAMVRQNPKKAAEIAQQVGSTLKQIDSGEKQVNAVLGTEGEATVAQGGAEDVNDNKTIVEAFIANSENSTLTDGQKNDLIQVKQYYDTQDYQKALDYYLGSSLIK